MRVWVCQVRREAFVGGESQRCRHSVRGTETISDILRGCREMVLVGGEPIQWCTTHGSLKHPEQEGCWWNWYEPLADIGPCKFESNVRVKVAE